MKDYIQGALHNVNGEMGIDIILPDSLSVFLIYERNQALGIRTYR